MSRRLRPAGGAHSVNFGISPLLAARTPPGRSRFAVALMALAFVALAAKAVWLQVINADFLRAQANKRQVVTENLPASRGAVLDRHGALLAVSVPALDIAVRPRQFAAGKAQLRQLAGLLGMPVADLERRVRSDASFVYLDRQASAELRPAIEALALPGVELVETARRSYPLGASAATLVGFTGVDEHGLEGIERAFDARLRGQDGQRTILRDRMGRPIDAIGEQLDPVPGANVRLAIDATIQFAAYQQLRDAVRAHAARSGSAVVVDSRTGEVLALANYPSYDPERRVNVAAGRMRNRALTDIFEPGSTIKPFTIALAIEQGIVRPDTRIDTAPGWIVVGGRTLKDSHPHGVLSVEEVVQKSSNVGTVKIAQQLSAQQMWTLFDALGIGQRLGLNFPGVAGGRLRPYRSWRPVEQATMSYGYGLSLSLVQLARAYTVFARDGELIDLSLVERAAAPPGVRVFSPATARAVRHMLQMAAAAGGTAPRAQTVGYSVGGKTGTARKLEGGVYSSDKYRAWFVGLAPLGEPRVVIAVMIDEPRKDHVYYGGLVAAPVFSRLVQQTMQALGVTPDRDFERRIVDAPAEAESF